MAKKKMIMHRATEVPQGWEIRVPAVSDENKILSEAAVPRSMVQNFYTQVADFNRCFECGGPSCKTGAKPKANAQKDTLGLDIKFKEPEMKGIRKCDVDVPIPEIHRFMSAAQQVFNEAYGMLLKVDSDSAEQIKAEQTDLDNIELTSIRASVGDKVFDALSHAGLETFAEKKRKTFHHFMQEAVKLSDAATPIHAELSRLCSDSRCKSGCVPGLTGHGSVEIPMNMAMISDYATEYDLLQPIKLDDSQKQNKTLLIIGSGFAGITAGFEAIKKGYDVVIVDKNAEPFEPGNKNILNYKVLQKRFKASVERLRQSGAQFVMETEVGSEGNRAIDLARKYNAEAVLYTTGTPFAKTLKLSGDAADTVQTWDKSLQQQQYHDNDDIANSAYNDNYNFEDKVVAVVGTSDTYVDVFHLAALQCAKQVIAISRGDYVGLEDVPALKKALNTAKAMVAKLHMKTKGVQYELQKYMQPQSLSYNEAGKKVLVGANRNADGENISLTVDEVVLAISNETGDLKKVFKDESLPTKTDGSFDPVLPTPEDLNAVAVDPQAKIGAGYLGDDEDGRPRMSMGDNTRGPSLAVTAAGDAKNAIKMLHKELSREDGQKPFSGYEQKHAL